MLYDVASGGATAEALEGEAVGTTEKRVSTKGVPRSRRALWWVHSTIGNGLIFLDFPLGHLAGHIFGTTSRAWLLVFAFGFGRGTVGTGLDGPVGTADHGTTGSFILPIMGRLMAGEEIATMESPSVGLGRQGGV